MPTITVVSAIGAGNGKCKGYAQGTAEPSNWRTSGFDDSGWPDPVSPADVGTIQSSYNPIAGCAWISDVSTSENSIRYLLHRRTIAVPRGTITVSPTMQAP